MLVREAKLTAKEWVRREGSRLPGMMGAFLAGSVTTLPDSLPLPASSDVDITVVLADPPARKLGKFRYGDALLEVSFDSPTRYSSVETVLGDPHLAGGIKAMQILADPTGGLGRLQSEVVGEYACRRWVRERCRAAIDIAVGRLQPGDESAPLHDRVTAWLFGTSLTALVPLLAGLRAPTVRRRYAEVRKLMCESGSLDFHEELLALLGCAEWSRRQAEWHLDQVAEAFEGAKCLPKGDFQFAGDISDAARPVAIDGSRELIEQGLHREAIFWIVATYSRCQWIFHYNASKCEGDLYLQGYLSMLDDLGIRSNADLEARCKQVLAFLPRVTEMADAVMDATPGIREEILNAGIQLTAPMKGRTIADDITKLV